jgi:hypothetical protein
MLFTQDPGLEGDWFAPSSTELFWDAFFSSSLSTASETELGPSSVEERSDVPGSRSKDENPRLLREEVSLDLRLIDLEVLYGLAEPELDTVVSVSTDERASPSGAPANSVNSSSSKTGGVSPNDEIEESDSLDIAESVVLVVLVESLSMLIDLFVACSGFHGDIGDGGPPAFLEKSDKLEERNRLTPWTPSLIPSRTAPPLRAGELTGYGGCTLPGMLALNEGTEGRVAIVVGVPVAVSKPRAMIRSHLRLS